MLVLGLYRGADAYPRAEVAALLPAILRERTASLLTLHGLDAVEVEQLAAAALRHRPQEADVRAVQERAEGNPLFVLELLRLVRKAGSARSLPAGVREVIGRRLDRVPSATRDLLRQAAVLGNDFPLDLLAAVAGQPAAELLDRLEPAVVDELVTEADGQRLRFAHALIQEVAYAELSMAQRQQLHRRAAHAIEAPDGATDGADDELDALAHHLRQAAPLGDADEALRMTLQAASGPAGSWPTSTPHSNTGRRCSYCPWSRMRRPTDGGSCCSSWRAVSSAPAPLRPLGSPAARRPTWHVPLVTPWQWRTRRPCCATCRTRRSKTSCTPCAERR